MKINISAKPGEGVTPMAIGIANFLEGLGFSDVKLNTQSVEGVESYLFGLTDSCAPANASIITDAINKRLKARASVLSVEITTEQLPRLDFPANPPAPATSAAAPRRATIHPFTWGKVISEHEIGPYQIVEYHPYKSGGNPVDERGRRLPREVEAHTLFHVYYDGQDSNQSTNTLERAMLVAISCKTLGKHAEGLAMLCRALKIAEEGC